MKAIVLYRPQSEFARAVEEFTHDFKTRTPYDIELTDVDSSEGTALAELYDVMDYPTVIVSKDDGQLIKSWTGTPLPLVNDVAGYVRGQAC